MEFLNIGTGELLLILVLAFIVLGPGCITKLGRDIGSAVRKLNRNQTFRDVVNTTEEIRNYPRKIMQDAMLDQPISLDHGVDQLPDPLAQDPRAPSSK